MSICDLKQTLDAASETLATDHANGVAISQLLLQRSDTIDLVCTTLWQHSGLDQTQTTLIAVGGYGRAEMHPGSDVDLLLLLNEQPNADQETQLSHFLTGLWDLGLAVGHSVRTVEECIEEAAADLTIITNLMESRIICGYQPLFEQLHQHITPHSIWPSDQFFTAKLTEQQQRYQQYGDTAYRVEPNLKEGPGGLRDIQMIDWITERAFGTRLADTPTQDMPLSDSELKTLIDGKHFLWSVRFTLHQLAKRKEDRLLFDYQRALAHRFGYTNDENNESIERFMQRYYRTITALERLNEVLLGALRKRILPNPQTTPFHITPLYLNDDGYLGIATPDVFEQHPHTLLDVFYTLQVTQPQLKGLTPDTIRALRHSLHLIDDEFRANERHKKIFMNILNESSGITFVTRRMNRYGVLAAYIPAFANIVGRMQFDLFHAFTVDDHTLNLVRHIRTLSVKEGQTKYPFLSKVFAGIPKPQILYLASLFHDIAKGRKGSHSELGAVDALEFCQSHGLNEYDAKLVSWLVLHHLTMSTTAQRQDISDPDVIERFSELVGIQNRLDYLYLLTVCDIRSTNPTLLTDWKNALLQDLYKSTRSYLQQSTARSPTITELITERKNSAANQLIQHGINRVDCDAFWASMPEEYPLQYSMDVLTWHIRELHRSHDAPIVRIKQDERRSSSLVFIYTQYSDTLFTRVCSALEQMQINIVTAGLVTNHNGYALDTLTLLNTSGKAITLDSDQTTIVQTIRKNILNDNFNITPFYYRIPRKLKYFDVPTRVSFKQDETRGQTILTLYTADCPGLLTRISQVFYSEGLTIHSARIATLGEEAEDIFYLTNHNQQAITSVQQQARIQQALTEKLQQLWQ
ncbi:MAG: [protein-PII] uridylyltransferase [Leucothrix sp.]